MMWKCNYNHKERDRDKKSVCKRKRERYRERETDWIGLDNIVMTQIVCGTQFMRLHISWLKQFTVYKMAVHPIVAYPRPGALIKLQPKYHNYQYFTAIIHISRQ